MINNYLKVCLDFKKITSNLSLLPIMAITRSSLFINFFKAIPNKLEAEYISKLFSNLSSLKIFRQFIIISFLNTAIFNCLDITEEEGSIWFTFFLLSSNVCELLVKLSLIDWILGTELISTKKASK